MTQFRRQYSKVISGTVGVLVVVAAGVFVVWQSDSPGLPPGVSREDFRSGAEKFRELYGLEPDRMDVFSVLGELAMQGERYEMALACFEQIPIDHARYGAAARIQTGHALRKLNRSRDAEAVYRSFLQSVGQIPSASGADVKMASRWLVYLLAVELRFEERDRLLAGLHASGLAGVSDSKQFYFPNLLIWNSARGADQLRSFLDADPGDDWLNIAAGRYLTGEGRLSEAKAQLSRLNVGASAGLAWAAALLECHYERDDWAAFDKVMTSIGEPGEDEPWLLIRMRGEDALHREDWPQSVTHFSRLLEADPANPAASRALAQVYREMGEDAASERMQQRVLALARLRPGMVRVTESEPDASEELAETCESIGLSDAAATFRQHADRIRRGAGGRRSRESTQSN